MPYSLLMTKFVVGSRRETFQLVSVFFNFHISPRVEFALIRIQGIGTYLQNFFPQKNSILLDNKSTVLLLRNGILFPTLNDCRKKKVFRDSRVQRNDVAWRKENTVYGSSNLMAIKELPGRWNTNSCPDFIKKVIWNNEDYYI
ncbi:hypothetical protein NPIL_295411 [Nephila pilipes]|uniref:Uncharacterized protein n=1 Tax=Nephila pilipes TaxID=299642 RepID=A0A8X6UMT1_NEPPI|nr:hypothetical protein NPIL_295411 [Nephila pilipes]